MRSTRHLLISFLLVAAILAPGDTSAETRLVQQFTHCAAMGNDQKRLACYDELTRSVVHDNTQAQDNEFIQPSARFLESHLVTEAWKDEYTLTVRKFVDLIAHAIMENKQRVTVQGWSRDKGEYVLHITMRTPVSLYFLPRNPGGGDTPMSLLRDVTMDKRMFSAEQFVLIIAAMVPDDKT